MFVLEQKIDRYQLTGLYFTVSSTGVSAEKCKWDSIVQGHQMQH